MGFIEELRKKAMQEKITREENEKRRKSDLETARQREKEWEKEKIRLGEVWSRARNQFNESGLINILQEICKLGGAESISGDTDKKEGRGSFNVKLITHYYKAMYGFNFRNGDYLYIDIFTSDDGTISFEGVTEEVRTGFFGKKDHVDHSAKVLRSEWKNNPIALEKGLEVVYNHPKKHTAPSPSGAEIRDH